MEKETDIARYMIGGTNYTVVRNYNSSSRVEELIQRELNRLCATNNLTNQGKNDIMVSYVAGSH